MAETSEIKRILIPASATPVEHRCVVPPQAGFIGCAAIEL